MLLFNVLPIAVEFTMALAVMGTLAGPSSCLWATGTVAAYVVFTTHVSNQRRDIMKRRNKAEEEVSGRFFDSLSNCDAVKFFQNEGLEARRYDSALAKFEHEQVQVLRSLAALNFGLV